MGLEGVGRMATVHALEHPFAILLQLTHMIFEGVFERFPSLRVAFLEAGAGWVPYMMDRLDEEWEKPMGKGLPISQSPSALMSSGQIFVSCEVEESSLPEVIRRTGASQILWPSDFPHERPRSAFGGDLPKFHRRTDLSAEVKQAIVWENPKRFYRL